MLRAMWTGVAVVLLAVLAAACGGGGSGDGGTAGPEIKATLRALLLAAAGGDGEFARVQDKLAADEFRTTLGHASKAWAQLTPAERTEAMRSCFSQVMTVPRETTLKDGVAIDGALAAATLDVRGTGADISFQGPRADRPGQTVKFKARFTRYSDGTWRLVTCEGIFGK